MPSEADRQDHGPRHTATTPLDKGRYLEGIPEDVRGTVRICVDSPATRAGVQPPVLAVRLLDFATGVARLGSVGFAHLDHPDTVEAGLVGDHVGNFAERPSVQPLVDFGGKIDALPDARQVTDGDGIDTCQPATMHKVGSQDVKQVFHLPGLLPLDLPEAAALSLVLNGRGLHLGSNLIPIATDGLDQPAAVQEGSAIIEDRRNGLRLAQVNGYSAVA